MTVSQMLDRHLGGDGVPVKRVVLGYAALTGVMVILLLPFHGQLATLAASTPSWLLQPSPSLSRLAWLHAVEIGLIVLWCWLWVNRPEGVFGR